MFDLSAKSRINVQGGVVGLASDGKQLGWAFHGNGWLYKHSCPVTVENLKAFMDAMQECRIAEVRLIDSINGKAVNKAVESACRVYQLPTHQKDINSLREKICRQHAYQAETPEGMVVEELANRRIHCVDTLAALAAGLVL